MKVGTIVTLENKEMYYLADETFQNNIKYFLANQVDEDDELLNEAYVFEEKEIDGKASLKKVEDMDTLNFVMAIFASNIVNDIDKLGDE